MVEKNAIDCRPMKSEIDHAIGSRHSGWRCRRVTGSCARIASGSQTAAPTTAGIAQIASDASQPPNARSNGIAVNVAIVAPATSAIENAPVSTPTCRAPCARTHAGVTTWVSAIAAPASSVPPYSAAVPPSPRAAVPAGGHEQRGHEDPLDRVAARDPRPELGEDAEAQQRPGREQTGRRGGQSKLRAHVGQQRRQAPEQRAQVDPGQDDRDRQRGYA